VVKDGAHVVTVLEYITLKREGKSGELNTALVEYLGWLNKSDGPQYNK